MSFCSELKNELCNVRPSGCCEAALCYGFMLFSRSFSYNSLEFGTENKRICDYYVKLLKSNFAIIPQVKIGGNVKKNYRVKVTDKEQCARVMQAFGYTGTDNLSINRDVFKRGCCFGAFIRGAFLAAGQMNDPNGSYRAEFVIKDMVLALDFYRVLIERGLSPKRSIRSMSTVIYFNNIDTVEELLTVMNATGKTFELMDVRMTKNVRESINRKNNFEVKNLEKAANAAVDQTAAIEYLEKSGKLFTLPEELQNAARLRKNNPTESLSELCRRSREPITRSGLNHRLQKLIAIADEYKKTE